MRKTNDSGGTGPAVLDTPKAAPVRSSAPAARRTMPSSDPLRASRELGTGYVEDADTEAFLRASGRARRFRRNILPRTRNGRIAAGVGLLVALAGVGAGVMALTRYLTTSESFRIPSSAAIESVGNSHVSRSQMLSVFGEDVERNVFRVPMAQRRAELETMPWVEHATVMRLLPNHLRVHVVERVPVAFVRQGGTIGMVDAHGVLLDIPPDAPGNPSYSFPVVTGLKAEDAPEARAQRMKLYGAFLKDLDSDGKGTASQLSEIDLSDPEDVKALIPDHNAEVLVHFGTEEFLARYQRFEEHVAEWRQQYPHLTSVDMRYERQVVLQMPPKDSTVVGGPQAAVAPALSASKTPGATEVRSAGKTPGTATTPGTAKAPGTAKLQSPVTATSVLPVSTASPVPSAWKPVPLAKVPAAAALANQPATPVAPAVATAAPALTKAAPVKTPTAVAVKRAVPAGAGGKQVAKDAAREKRVEAIRAWMAKRQKVREAQAAKGGSASGTP